MVVVYFCTILVLIVLPPPVGTVPTNACVHTSAILSLPQSYWLKLQSKLILILIIINPIYRCINQFMKHKSYVFEPPVLNLFIQFANRVNEPWYLGAHDSSKNCGEPGCVEVTSTDVWIYEGYNESITDEDIAVVK